MGKLITLNDFESKEQFINLLKDNPIYVYEDIQGSSLFVTKNGGELIIKPRNRNGNPLSEVDTILQKYYNNAVEFFRNLNPDVKELMNEDWHFVFEYFPDNQPANIKYDRIPQNGLILTSILKGKNEWNYNFEEIREWAELFNCESLPLIFGGTLLPLQLELIERFLSTSTADLEFLFEEQNFAEFFYKILNPEFENSYLMSGKWNENLERVFIRFQDPEISSVTLSILNPLYQKVANQDTEFLDVYTILIMNFIEFCLNQDWDSLSPTGNTKSAKYISSICKLFNRYISEVREDILKFNFEIPKFFQEDKFGVNIEELPNDQTKEILKDHKKFEYLFKIFLGSLQKKKKTAVGIFDERTLRFFNNFVEDFQKYLDKEIGIKGQGELLKGDLLTFSQFLSDETDIPDIFQNFRDIDKEKGFGKEVVVDKEGDFKEDWVGDLVLKDDELGLKAGEDIDVGDQSPIQKGDELSAFRKK